MNFKSAPAALILCACAVMSAAGCAATSAPRNEGGTAPRAELVSQANVGGDAQGAAGKVRSPLPAPTGFVNDYADALGAEEKRALEAKLARL